MSAGGVWTAGSDSDSAARLNQKTVTIDTGTNLSALATTYPGQLIYSTDTSGAFTANTMYQRNAANNAWTAQLPMTTHDHSTNLATTGGLLSDILSSNTGQVLYYNFPSPRTANFFTQTTGGTITDDISIAGWWRVKLDTAIVASNYAQADIGGIALDFGSKIKFQTKVEVQAAFTSLQCRMGVNVDKSNANASQTTKSLGFEFCDSSGSTYQLASGDGTARTTVNTTQSFAGPHALKFQYTPSTSVVGTVDQTVATTKLSNLPNSGAALPQQGVRFGIMTTNTVSKQLYIYGVIVVGTDNDIWY
jgi:hypothetical protein